jgi:hypothetical protein
VWLLQKKIEELGFEFVSHLPYSPDLARSDFHLFPKLKIFLGVFVVRQTSVTLEPYHVQLEVSRSIFFCYTQQTAILFFK